MSNITVINCTMNGAVNGIRIKSDNDRGGLVQNISYYNIGMTNVNFPIQIYALLQLVWHAQQHFAAITPQARNAAAISYSSGGGTPIYRNITFSNITATSVQRLPRGHHLGAHGNARDEHRLQQDQHHGRP